MRPRHQHKPPSKWRATEVLVSGDDILFAVLSAVALYAAAVILRGTFTEDWWRIVVPIGLYVIARAFVAARRFPARIEATPVGANRGVHAVGMLAVPALASAGIIGLGNIGSAYIEPPRDLVKHVIGMRRNPDIRAQDRRSPSAKSNDRETIEKGVETQQVNGQSNGPAELDSSQPAHVIDLWPWRAHKNDVDVYESAKTVRRSLAGRQGKAKERVKFSDTMPASNEDRCTSRDPSACRETPGVPEAPAVQEARSLEPLKRQSRRRGRWSRMEETAKLKCSQFSQGDESVVLRLTIRGPEGVVYKVDVVNKNPNWAKLQQCVADSIQRGSFENDRLSEGELLVLEDAAIDFGDG
jgi:hypothetical protein